MPVNRKLGRPTDQRMAILKNLVTALILEGKITTTVTRAKEVQRIAEKLITLSVKEKDNFTTREIVVSAAKLDSKGKKLLETKTNAKGKKYDVVVREAVTREVQVDNPSRLAARKQCMQWLQKANNVEGEKRNPVNKLFNDIAPRYATRAGGYTRIIALGARRGDAAEMAVLELI